MSKIAVEEVERAVKKLPVSVARHYGHVLKHLHTSLTGALSELSDEGIDLDSEEYMEVAVLATKSLYAAVSRAREETRELLHQTNKKE